MISCPKIAGGRQASQRFTGYEVFRVDRTSQDKFPSEGRLAAILCAGASSHQQSVTQWSRASDSLFWASKIYGTVPRGAPAPEVVGVVPQCKPRRSTQSCSRNARNGFSGQ